MAELIQLQSPRYRVGSIYRFINRRLSIEFLGPFEFFLETYAGGVPNGVEICNLLETIIQAKPVSLSIKSALTNPARAESVSHLEEFLKCYNEGASGSGAELAADELLRVGAFLGDIALIDSALARGTQIDSEGFAKMTALHWSTVRDMVDVSRLLVERGADYSKVNECAYDLLDLSMANGCVKSREFIARLGFKEHGAAFKAMLRRWKVGERDN